MTSLSAVVEEDWIRFGTQFQDGLGWEEDEAKEVVDDEDEVPVPSACRIVPVLEDDVDMSTFSLLSSFDCCGEDLDVDSTPAPLLRDKGVRCKRANERIGMSMTCFDGCTISFDR